MYRAAFAKFSQNAKLANYLKGTGKTELVDANPSDNYWGVGMSLRDKSVFNKDMWKGKNRAGAIISKARSEIVNILTLEQYITDLFFSDLQLCIILKNSNPLVLFHFNYICY